jgi:cell division septation protein DedD
MDEIYYRINGGDTQTVTANGQPTITTSSANNTLEYWCNWTINGISLQTTHILLKDIKLDKTTPTEQPQATNAPQASTSTNPTTTPKATHYTPATTAPTNEPKATPIPEFSFGTALLLLALTSLLLVLAVKRRQAGMHS